MQLDIINSKGEKTGRSVELPEEIFNAEPNDHVIYLAVKQYLAAQRLGTHKTKTRAEVKGSSKKLHRQKGTGGSRKGNIRNPLYKGGGTINGPLPHGYGFKLNRKVKDLAKISALSYKARENKLVIVEDFQVETPSTKTMAGILSAIAAGARKPLIVSPEVEESTYLSIRNIPNADVTVLSDINTYQLVNSDLLIMTESAAKLFNETTIEPSEA